MIALISASFSVLTVLTVIVGLRTGEDMTTETFACLTLAAVFLVLWEMENIRRKLDALTSKTDKLS